MQRAHSDTRDARDRAKRLKAIAMMCAAIVSFSVLDATAKYLAQVSAVPVAQIIWIRFIGNALLIMAMLGPVRTVRIARSARRPGQQWLRSAFMMGATVANFFAVKYLRLDQTITIFFTTPLIVAALSGPLLDEWVGWRRLTAIIIGFLGIVLVMRPGFGGVHPAIAFSFAAALSYALYNIGTRFVAAHDEEAVSQAYTPLAGLLVMAPFAIAVWSWPDDALTWALLVSLGLTGGVGHWLLVKAHQHAPSPILAPFVYIGLLSMTALGYVLFGDVPDMWTLLGGLVIIGSGLYLLSRERRGA